MKKIAFYVSANATRLKKFLLMYGNDNILNNIEFILIDCIENTELEQLCLKHNIKYHSIDLSRESNKNIKISNLFLKLLNQYHIDYAFVFANRILVGDLLKDYKNKLINFHPSILPSHKGLMAIDKALEEKTFLLGNSAHLITSELDGGDVIMQNIFPSIRFKNYDEVLDKQLPMLRQLMQWIIEDRLMVENSNVSIKNASYAVSEFIPNLEIQYDKK